MKQYLSRIGWVFGAVCFLAARLPGQDVRWVQGGHSDDVNWVAFAPDGSYLAVSGWDGVIRFYDRSSLDVLRTFRSPSRPYMFAISGDGKSIAAGRYEISIWNAANGDLKTLLKGHGRRVTSVAFSPDAKLLVSASQDSTLRLWDTSTGDSLATLLGHRGTVAAVDFSSDGTFIVSTGQDSTVRVWSLASKSLIRTIAVGRPLGAAVISPDGSRIAAGVGDSTITVWDVSTGLPLKKFGPDLAIYRVLFSPDGQEIVSGGGVPTTVTVRSAASGQVLHKWDVGNQFLAMDLSSDGESVVHTSKLAKVWNLSTGVLESVIAGHTGRITAVAVSPTGQYSASGSEDAQVIVRSGATGEWIRSFSLGTFNDVTAVTFSSGDRYLAVASRTDTVCIWDTRTWDIVMKVHGGYGGGIAFAPDGQQIATDPLRGSIQLYNVPAGTPATSFATGFGLYSTSVSFSPDGKNIAACDDSYYTPSMRIWEVSTGKEVFFVRADEGPMRAVVFSPDGKRIVGSRLDGVTRMWGAGLWDSLWTVQARFPAMSFSPDGKYLATGSDSGRVQFWDAATGTQVKAYASDYGLQLVLAFSPDGASIFSGTDGGCVLRWSVGTLSGAEGGPCRFPEVYTLRQNYPNPFNPTTTLRYGLPERSHVNLAVFNTLGQQVALLQNGEQEAGYHDVEFDASSLPSGVYFYRLQAGSYVETRKLCLVR